MDRSAPASWTIECPPDRGFVQVTTSGALDLLALQTFAMETLAFGNEHSRRRFLIDHRLAATDLGALDIFELPTWYESIGVAPDMKIATVLAKDTLSREDFDLFHARASSRGNHGYRLFVDMDDAAHWLAETD